MLESGAVSGESSPDGWGEAVSRIIALPPGSTALILGGTDTGKTTFAARVARELSEDSERIAVVDADIGQSEIAPPGTVGVAWARPSAERLSELKPAGTFFVGTFSASTLPLEHATATLEAVRHARQRHAERILVDTTGYITGPTARRLKAAKAALIRPELILAFGADTNGELLALAQTAAAVCGAELLPVPVPKASKTAAAQRTTRRQTRLAATNFHPLL
jgi:polynucleotide 5'-hydroxyl-kinase GRC3/NOL9